MMSSKQKWFIEKLQKELSEKGNTSEYVEMTTSVYETTSTEASAIIEALLTLKNGGSNEDATYAWMKKAMPSAYAQGVKLGAIK